MTYREPTVMKERLASHKQKLDWQLRRIYRARNYVMHRGRSVQGMRQLIQHLHTYYIMLIHTIIHDLKYRPLWGIEEACESRKNLYANALVRLKDHKNSPIAIEDILRFFSPGYSATPHTHQVWAHLLQPEVPA
jgi:GTP1/Obg family GTP-binding protein